MRYIIFVASLFLITVSARAQTVPSSDAEIKLSFAPIVQKVAPAVVNIYTKRRVQSRQSLSPFFGEPFFNHFFNGRGYGMPKGQTRERIESSLGSGVIIQSNGIVITNAHVVENAVETVIVLNDGREFDAEVSLIDSASDLAILHVDANNLPYATLKPSDSLEVGDLVLAIGNPFGVGQTVTSGIVSAVARSTMNINDFNFFIQTDAAINPGNSGGPLVDMSGHVVGINTAIYSRDGGSLGIGFSVPSEMVSTIINAERTGNTNIRGGIKRPWLGLSSQNITSDIAGSLDLKSLNGALISDLHPLSPLKQSGLQKGDIITAINDRAIKDAAEMRFRLLTFGVDDIVHITYHRDGTVKKTNIKMMHAPNKPDRDKTHTSGDNILNGLHSCFINPALEEDLGIDLPHSGVVVCDIDTQSYARRIVRIGDVILNINGYDIEKPKDILKASKTISKQGLYMTLIRDGQKQVLRIR